jgi:deoxyribodipyrimidine photo-lyase
MSTKKGKSSTSSKTTANTSSTIHHIVAGDAPTWMNRERTRIVTFPQGVTKPNIPTSEDSKLKSCVYYWMQRDVRAVDNWALHYAEFLAQKYQVPLRVVYTLPPPPPSSKPSAVGDPSNTTVLPPKVYDMNLTHRHGMFLIEGLKYVSKELSKVHTPLDILFPSSRDEVGSCLYQHVCPDSLPSQKSSKTSPPQSNTNMNAIAVVCDMSPLRHFRTWTEDQAAPLLANASIPLIQVDAHNIVPVWYASDKREVGARTLRPRIHRHLEPFLTHYPTFHGNQHMSSSSSSTIPILKSDQENGSLWNRCIQYLSLDESVKLPSHYQAGADAAMKQFHLFCEQGLKVFDTERNDPNFSNVCSSLSPWINYGHVSFQRLALEVRALKKYPNGTASYLEEGIVRRELSDNFCYYAKDHYDELSAAAGWAIETLRVHESDPREYVYSLGEFERGATHDELWNAAQVRLLESVLL